MSELLSTSRMLELLEEVRTVARDFASREEGLNREHRNLSEAAEVRQQQALKAAEVEWADRLAHAQARQDLFLGTIQSKFASRERRLHDGHASARKAAFERVDHEEGRRKYAVQKGTLEAQRRREELLAANDAALAQFRGRLAEARHDLELLEGGTRRAFGGMPLFQRFLRQDTDGSGMTALHGEMLEEAQQLQTEARTRLAEFRRLLAPKLFRSAPLWVWVVLALGLAAGLSPALQRLAFPVSPNQAYGYAGAVLAFAVFLYFAAYQSGAARAGAISGGLVRARALQLRAEEKAQEFHTQEIARIERETSERIQLLETEWENAVADAKQARAAWPEHLEEKWRRARLTNEEQRAQRTAARKAANDAELTLLKVEGENRQVESRKSYEIKVEELRAAQAAGWKVLESEWKARMTPLLDQIQTASKAAELEFPDWTSAGWQRWKPPVEFKNFTPWGRLEVDWAKYAGVVPQDDR
ncbi:MAG TPA: hypothetical protein VK633_09930, partial [Verrucomicrobiae bacterium]|nr:hypothetical protein [Verrucomicrobiae bacterium]